MLLLNPIVSGSMSMSGSMSVNNQSLDQYISSSIYSDTGSLNTFISSSVVSQGLASAGGGGGADADLGVYGLVGLEQEYYAIAASTN